MLSTRKCGSEPKVPDTFEEGGGEPDRSRWVQTRKGQIWTDLVDLVHPCETGHKPTLLGVRQPPELLPVTHAQPESQLPWGTLAQSRKLNVRVGSFLVAYFCWLLFSMVGNSPVLPRLQTLGTNA